MQHCLVYIKNLQEGREEYLRGYERERYKIYAMIKVRFLKPQTMER